MPTVRRQSNADIRLPFDTSAKKAFPKYGYSLVNIYPHVIHTEHGTITSHLTTLPGVKRGRAITGRVLKLLSVGDTLFYLTTTGIYKLPRGGEPETLIERTLTGTGHTALASVDGKSVVALADGRLFGVKRNGDPWTPNNDEYPIETKILDMCSAGYRYVYVGADYIYCSEVYEADFRSAFAQAEGLGDKHTGVEYHAGVLRVFGGDSIESWSPANVASSVDFPYVRAAPVTVGIGTYAPDSIQIINGQLYWLGTDGAVYRGTSATNASQVSREALEEAVSARPGEIDKARIWSLLYDGTWFIGVTLEDETWLGTTEGYNWVRYTDSLGRGVPVKSTAQIGTKTYIATGADYMLESDDQSTDYDGIQRPHYIEVGRFRSNDSVVIINEVAVGVSSAGGVEVGVQVSYNSYKGYSEEVKAGIEQGDYENAIRFYNLGAAYDFGYKFNLYTNHLTTIHKIRQRLN